MKTLQLLEEMKKRVVFTPNILKKHSKNYAGLYINRLAKKNLVKKIERNLYTVHSDPFLIASRIVWPSYISCWSGLKFHNLTEQVPHKIFVIVSYYKKPISFQNTQIIFIVTKSSNMFGYEKIKYGDFEIFVADIEKTIIDAVFLRKASFSEVQEIIRNNLDNINLKRFIKYLKKIENKSLIKRFGYYFDLLGKDFYFSLNKYIDQTYIPLDYTKEKTGEKNEKWRIIKNA